MTSLLDFPTTPVLGAPAYRSELDEFRAYKRAQASAAFSGPFTVDGVSALVPGTTLRLPVLPEVRGDSVRCAGCAGTGVMFDGGHPLATNALTACFCMELD